MPYLDADSKIATLLEGPSTPGGLNYYITQACLDYLETTEERYADHAAVVGALECAKLEFYRRALAVYEDEAIAKNGDVY